MNKISYKTDWLSCFKMAVSMILACMLPVHSVWAWNNFPHETIGAIADQLITGSLAEAKVHEILKPGETLESIAIWADCAKDVQKLRKGCEKLDWDELKAFADKTSHGRLVNQYEVRYHFTSVPFQATSYNDDGVGAYENDIVHILKECIGLLQGKTSASDNPHQFTPRQALLLLTHLIGDIHQPIHVGVAYINSVNHFDVPVREEEESGLQHKKSFFNAQDELLSQSSDDCFLSIGKVSNFRAFWNVDAFTIARQNINEKAGLSLKTPVEFANYMIHHEQIPALNSGAVMSWPQQWATEALAVSKQAHQGLKLGRPKLVHRGCDVAGDHEVWPIKLTDEYKSRASSLAYMQVKNAGFRLANVLEAIWK